MTSSEIKRTLFKARLAYISSRTEFSKKHKFVSYAGLYLLENEKHEPRLSTLISWAEALGYRVELVKIATGEQL